LNLRLVTEDNRQTTGYHPVTTQQDSSEVNKINYTCFITAIFNEVQQTPILSNQKIVNPIQLSKMRKYIPNNLFALVLTIGSDLILCEIFLKKIVAI